MVFTKSKHLLISMGVLFKEPDNNGLIVQIVCKPRNGESGSQNMHKCIWLFYSPYDSNGMYVTLSVL